MKFLESLLPKLFIALIPSGEGVSLYAEFRKQGSLRKRYEAELVEEHSELKRKVSELEKESAVSYIAYLETSASQGLLPNCQAPADVELSSVETICVENRWGVYMSKDDLFSRQKMYKNIGLDFIFSPFSLLYCFFEETIQERDGLYLLLTEDFVCSAVFKDQTMLFGKQVMMQDALALIDSSKMIERYSETIQITVKAFYDTKVDETMFIEKIYIADTMDFEAAFENRLEETLFAEVEKLSIDLGRELIALCEKELA